MVSIVLARLLLPDNYGIIAIFDYNLAQKVYSKIFQIILLKEIMMQLCSLEQSDMSQLMV